MQAYQTRLERRRSTCVDVRSVRAIQNIMDVPSGLLMFLWGFAYNLRLYLLSYLRKLSLQISRLPCKFFAGTLAMDWIMKNGCIGVVIVAMISFCFRKRGGIFAISGIPPTKFVFTVHMAVYHSCWWYTKPSFITTKLLFMQFFLDFFFHLWLNMSRVYDFCCVY